MRQAPASSARQRESIDPQERYNLLCADGRGAERGGGGDGDVVAGVHPIRKKFVAQKNSGRVESGEE